MPRTWGFVRTSHVAAPPDAVWRRMVSPDGINDEMWPWLTMSAPRGAGDLTIDGLPLGVPVGRAWLRLGGVVPFEYDDLVITELEPGRRFREESTMATMRRWGHERTVTAGAGGGATVTDRVDFAPRVAPAWIAPLLRPVLAAFFAHRHRRLVRHFAGPPSRGRG
ncbi:SRPBCC family protein [Actinomycetospora aeridis]|uniref:Polyketide cyclase/dehydrase/lipid transport protein n=1 Tax=Actinomycetospora aeridis TaxID=3129231 RepID=A0ABU8MXX5_9PSEU